MFDNGLKQITDLFLALFLRLKATNDECVRTKGLFCLPK